MSTPGIGDPYWYEWSVGLKKIIEMLNPDNKIDYVILQSEKHNTIDDVVVVKKNNSEEFCYQVKHSRDISSANNMTFSKLFESSGSEREKDNIGKSLLNSIAFGWNEEHKKSPSVEIHPIIYTNRKSGPKKTTRNKKFQSGTYKALPLEEFLNKIKKRITDVKDIDEIIFPDEFDLSYQWEEFANETGLKNEEVILFTKNLELQISSPSLEALERELICDLSDIFSCNLEIATKLFEKLAAQLRIWATSRRRKEKITSEDVYNILIDKNEIIGSHDLFPPMPFFNTRKIFCNNLINQLNNGKESVVFLEGVPGSGKTSLVSYIYKTSNIIKARFFAFKPISPEDRVYNPDSGLCEPRILWGDILSQLREYFIGEIEKYNIPVINEFCKTIELKKHVIRLSQLLYEKTNEKTIICIDGIDHAARSNSDITFLDELYLPSQIPEGVVFLIAGQPAQMYSKYPYWLREKNDLVKTITIPKLSDKDIFQLVKTKKLPFLETEDQILKLSKFIQEKTDGNNLSVVFAIEECRTCKSISEVIENINSKELCGDIHRYYDYIWRYAELELVRKGINLSFPGITIASCIILHNGIINSRHIFNAISSYNLTQGDWDYLLSLLYPLIVKKEEHQHEVLHNDFRVYLEKLIRTNNYKYKEIAANFADYYWKNESFTYERVRYGINLLISADRNYEIAKYFDTKFVVECFAERIQLNRLYEYAKIAFDSAIQLREFDFLYQIGQAYFTISQQIRYFEYYQKDYKEKVTREDKLSVRTCELEALPLTSRTITDYQNVLTFSKELLESEYQQDRIRAIDLIELWFGEYTPELFAKRIIRESEENADMTIDENSINNICTQWGSLLAEIGKEHFYFDDALRESGDKFVIKACLDYNDSYLDYLFSHKQYNKWSKAINKGGFSIRSLESQLESYNRLIQTDKSLLNFMEQIFNKSSNKTTKLLAIFNLITSDQACFRTKGETFLDIVEISPVKHLVEKEINEILYWCIVYACKSYSRDLSNIVSDVYPYIKESLNKRENNYLLPLMLAAVTAGKICGYNVKSKKPIGFQENVFNRIIENFFKIFNGPKSYNYRNSANLILTIIISNIDCLNQSYIERFDRIMYDFLFSDPMGMFNKSIVLDYFIDKDNKEIVEKYIGKLYGDRGVNILKKPDCEEIHLHWYKYGCITKKQLMDIVDIKLKWAVVNYTGNEDQALYKPLDWYKKYLEFNVFDWKNYGLKLYTQSYIASEIGSNAARWEIDKVIAKAAYNSSIQDYWEFIQWNKELYHDLNLMYQVIYQAIENCDNEEEAFKIWIWSVGILSWYNKDDRQGVNSIIDALEKKSNKLKWKRLMNSIEKSSYLHFSFWKKSSEILVEDTDYTMESKRKTDDFVGLIHNWSMEEIFDFLEKLPERNYSIWEFINIVIIRLRKQNLIKKYLHRLLNLVISRDQGYRWQEYGILTTIKMLMDDLSKDDIWVIAENMSRYFKNDTKWQLFYALHANIHCLCLSGIKLFEEEKINTWLTQSLDVQRTWISGASRMDIQFDVPQQINSNLRKPTNLTELIINIFLIQLDSRNSHRIEIAISGLDMIYMTDNATATILSNQWTNFTEAQKEYLRLLFEKWSMIESDNFEPLYRIVIDEYKDSNQMDTKLQSYYIVNNYLMSNNKEPIGFELNADSINYTIPKKKKSILEINRQKDNVINYTLSGVKYKLEALERVTNDDTEDILEIYNDIKSSVKNGNDITSPHRTGDSIIIHETFENRIMKIIYGEAKTNRWKDCEIVSIAQAILFADDAWIVSQIPMLAKNKELWDVENLIIRSIESRNKKNIMNIAKKIINDGISNDDIVIGAELFFPFGYYEQCLGVTYTKVAVNPYALLRTYKPIPSVNTKTLFLYDEHHFELNFSNEYECFFRVNSGLSRFVHGNCKIYPSMFVKTMLKWKPSRNNPLIWIDNSGNEVMRFEMISCPNRDNIHQQYIRQPILFRWVSKNSVIQKLKDKKIIIDEAWDIRWMHK
ncbi:hypothetical protein [Wukongibacter baidiensis]